MEEKIDRGLIAETLQDLRKRTGLSWTDLSIETQVSKESLEHLSRDAGEAELRTIKRLAEYFGWTPTDVGMVVLHVPTNILPKERRGAKRKKNGQTKDSER